MDSNGFYSDKELEDGDCFIDEDGDGADESDDDYDGDYFDYDEPSEIYKLLIEGAMDHED